MGTTKHRKNHKQKIQARKKTMLAKRKEVDKLMEQLKTEMGNLNPDIPRTIYSESKSGITLTETPNTFEL